MSLFDKLKDDLLSGGFAEAGHGRMSRVSVSAGRLAEGVWKVSGIDVARDYGDVADFRHYADKLAERLESPVNPVGKGWQVLEAGRDYATLVSGRFSETEADYRAFKVDIHREGIHFGQYRFRKGLELPWRFDDEAVLLSGQIDALLGSLAEE